MVREETNSRKWVFILVFLGAILLYFDSTMMAQTRRALLVGINKYEPEEPIKKPLCRKVEGVSNLLGSINDVEAMKGVLISRFYFKAQNIHVLKDEEATRQNILSGIETHLVKEAASGDVCVFYFAGHGSRMKNSKSSEPDKKDETLVPFDWYRVDQDIRDKELKKLFNRILDKKAKLTVIIDACHSGSISRGLPAPMRTRSMLESTCDAAEPPDREPEPAIRGALILSAARDFQRAYEMKAGDGNYYGVFTWALLKVLRSVPKDEPVNSIFLRVNALIKSEGMRPRIEISLHDPNLELLSELREQPLFGKTPGKDRGIVMAAAKVQGKRIRLLAGYAAGIREACELNKIPEGKKDGEEPKESPVRVRVEKVYGLNLCRAVIIQGDAGEIKVGDLFEIERWVASQEARLRVFLSKSNLSHKTLLDLSRVAEALRNPSQIRWVDDPTGATPTHIMSWKESQWWLQTRDGKTIKLGKSPGTDTILKSIMSCYPAGHEKPLFFLHLPLSSEIQKIMAPEIECYKDSIEIMPSSRDAHYILVGRHSGKNTEYAWAMPNMIREEGEGFAMPLRTRWITVGRDELSRLKAVNDLCKNLLQLVKIRAWLQLSSPPDRGHFPYRLALKNAKTGKTKTSGPLMEGETCGLVLRAYKEKPVKKIHGSYVYVFSIDSYGKGTLLFPPRHRRNSENYFPASDEFQTEIQLGDKELFKIGKPFGIDTYFLLTTEEAITNLEVLDFKGVRREPYQVKQYTPLERLLYGLDLGDRGRPLVTHMNWSIEWLPLLSKPYLNKTVY